MIKIQRSEDLDTRFFDERNFDESFDTVRAVLTDVRQRGDDAIRELAARFDEASPHDFAVSEQTLFCAAAKLKKENPDLYDAIRFSRDQAVCFAQKQRECFTDFEEEIALGVFAGQQNIPVERAGLYVPAGRFPLVSTVIMTSSPAVAAGVGEIILCTPPKRNPSGGSEPYCDQKVMAAAWICGVRRVFACGGAQAIAAMAFGTQTVPRVDIIAGPGNKFVAQAKRLVFGTVGIDMIAGPTEVFIIADESADPAWLAADLLAQAEHDVLAQPVLAVTSELLAHKVAEEIERQLETLSTKEVARQSIDGCGLIIVAKSLEDAARIANEKAPEHLELAMKAGEERDKVRSLVHNFGSLFVGHSAAEVLGDYSAGINHTLPTSGSARFSGGLSVRSFLKTVTTLRADPTKDGFKRTAQTAAILGDAEGLAAHAQAARLRVVEGEC